MICFKRTLPETLLYPRSRCYIRACTKRVLLYYFHSVNDEMHARSPVSLLCRIECRGRIGRTINMKTIWWFVRIGTVTLKMVGISLGLFPWSWEIKWASDFFSKWLVCIIQMFVLFISTKDKQPKRQDDTDYRLVYAYIKFFYLRT